MTSAAGPTPAPVPGAAGPADVHLDAGGDVAVLTLDRPAKLNATGLTSCSLSRRNAYIPANKGHIRAMTRRLR
jgi:hypothetical protein